LLLLWLAKAELRQQTTQTTTTSKLRFVYRNNYFVSISEMNLCLLAAPSLWGAPSVPDMTAIVELFEFFAFAVCLRRKQSFPGNIRELPKAQSACGVYAISAQIPAHNGRSSINLMFFIISTIFIQHIKQREASEQQKKVYIKNLCY